MERLQLPEELDSFVGRQDEVNTLASLVAPESRRLVTLTGPGGAGKSRLALRLAHHLHYRTQWPDGIGWVWLRPVRDPARLADHIAASLGLQQVANTTAGLIDAIRTKKLLLVIDNCEHLRSPLRKFVAALLRAAPEVTVLATSRSSLELPGETVHRLAPLSTATGETFQEGQCYESAELFVHRARQVTPDFDAAGQYRAIVELCHQVDGLPLAIELLARRTQTFSLAEITRRRFDLLNDPTDSEAEHDEPDETLSIRIPLAEQSGSPLDIGEDDAQRALTSLDKVLHWSWVLCTPHQRILLQRLAVFPDTFGLVDADSVCADSDLPQGVIARTIDALQKQSLVQRQSDTRHPASQFKLLATVQTFAESRLQDSGQEWQVRDRHVQWVTQAFAEAAQNWLGPQEADVLLDCRSLLLDVYAALDHCHVKGDMDAAFTLLTHVFASRVTWFGGALSDMTRQWRRFLDRWQHRDEKRAVALASLAYLEVCRGMPNATTHARIAEAQSIADELDVELLPIQIADAVQQCFGEGNTASVPLMGQAYDRQRAENPDDPMWAMTEMWWAICAAIHANSTTAESITQRHLQTMTAAGAEHALGWARWARAVHLLLRRGDDPAVLAEVEELIQAGVATASRMGDRWIPTWWAVLAVIRAAKAGQYVQAAEAAGVVASLTSTTGIQADRIAVLYPALCAGQDAALHALGEETYLAHWQSTHDQAAGNYAATVELLKIPVSLTRREREIVDLVANEHSIADIASTLHIQRDSVNRNLSRIYGKTGCRTPQELLSWIRAR